MANRTDLNFKVDEGESFDLTVTLEDTAGAAVDPAAVTTFTLTLFDEVTGAVLNSRNAQDIQNTNGCTISANVATVRLDALDNVLFGNEDENHVGRIAFSYNDGTTVRTGKGEFLFRVVQQQAVSAFV